MASQLRGASQLASIRRTFVRLMPFPATVIRPSDPGDVNYPPRNADGSDSDDWDAGSGSTQFEYPNCGVSPMGMPTDQITADALQGSRPWSVKFPFDTDVIPGDQIWVEGFGYHVIDTNEGKSNAFTLQCVCRRLQTAGTS